MLLYISRRGSFVASSSDSHENNQMVQVILRTMQHIKTNHTARPPSVRQEI